MIGSLGGASVAAYPSGEPPEQRPNGKLAWSRPAVTEVTGAEAEEIRRTYEAEQAQASPAGIGHNSGAQPMQENDENTSIARKKAYYIEVITDWFANRRKRTSEFMTPEEIGACENRAALLLHAMAIGIASIYREELFNRQSTESAEECVRGAFAMMGVCVVDIYFSHSDRGCSTASAERVAELLGCGVNTVKRARFRLVEHRVLIGGRKDGHGDRWWPAISRKMATDPKASVVWLLDATSAPIKRGRPTEIQAPDAGPRLDGEIWAPDAGPRFTEAGKSRPPSLKSSTQNPKSSTRMRGHETLDLRQDFLSGADAPACATEDLFTGGVPDQVGASSEGATKDTSCKPSAAESKAKRAAPRPKATEEQFGRFWDAYPKRDGKAKARERFLALTREDADLAIAGAKAYADQCRVKGTEPRYIKWPQGWLSDRRFEDYADAPSPASTIEPEAALRRLAATEAGKEWIAMLGPEKGMEKLRSILAASTKGAS